MRDRSSRGAIGAVMMLLLVAAMACPGLPSPALAEEAEGEANPPAQELAAVDQAEPEGIEAEAEGVEPKTDEGEAAEPEATTAAEATVAEDEGQAKAVAVDEGQAVSASEEEKQTEPSAEDEQAEPAAGEQRSDGDPEEGSEEDSEDLALTAQGASVVASGTWGTCPWKLDSNGTMTVGPGEGEHFWSDTSYPWKANKKTRRVVFARGTVLPSDCSGLFEDCSYITAIDASGCNTSKVTDMSWMFDGCSALATLNVSGWNTSSVTNMRYMFRSCSKLSSLGVGGWDTSSVTDMSYMFSGCSSLSSLSVSGWDTSSVTSMSDMFSGCSSLSSLSVSGWDTSSVTDMQWMFINCSKLTTLSVGTWDTSSVTNMSYMFQGCSGLSSLNVSGWNTWLVSSMSNMFSSCSSLTSFSAPKWDTSTVASMSYMFAGCSKLSTIDVSGWDTSTAANRMDGMFSSCYGVKKITVGKKFNVNKAFPQGYGSTYDSNGMWKSSSNSTVYTTEKVMSSRKGIADTYYARGSLKNAYIEDISTQPYSGKEVKPALKVTFGDRTLVAGTDYTVTYKNNVKEGEATATIKGKGYYVDSLSTTFYIERLTPTWSGATRLPVSATADIKVTNGGWIRLRSGGKWVTSDKVLSLSSPSTTTKRVTAKAPGTTTLYLLDATGKQVATKKVTVYAINGKTYEFESSVDKSYVLDIQGGSTKNGAQMIVYKRNNGANQKYQTYLQKDGTYAIRSLKSKKWLTVEPKTNKYVQQWSWKGDKSQLWRLTVDASNRVTFVNAKTNKCFDVQGGKTKNSAKMIVWQSNGGRNQKWKLNQK